VQSEETSAPGSPLDVAFMGLRGIPAAYGGVDRVIEEVAPGLAFRGHHVLVYCWSNSYKEHLKTYKGVELRYLPTIPVRYIGTLLHTLLACIGLLGRRVHVVHINNTQNALFAFIPRMCGTKVVVQPHGPAWPVLRWGTWRDRFWMNLKIRLTRMFLHLCRYPTLWFADRILVISQPDADYISKTKTDKFVLIHNGCNLPEPLPPKEMLRLGVEPGKYVLFVGRMMPRKGCHHLIRAFTEIETDVDLVIVGGPLDTAYGRFLRRLAGGHPRIRFTGPLYGGVLNELFSNTVVYVHPSESEGQSIALLEGLAYGACVLSSDTPESVETAEDTAVYFKSGDWEDLKRVLGDLLKDPGRMAEMGRRARAHVRSKYQWHDKIIAYERMYMDLVRQSNKP
jgi:glycosyltransferase involved in cell wall biosynthesis